MFTVLLLHVWFSLLLLLLLVLALLTAGLKLGRVWIGIRLWLGLHGCLPILLVLLLLLLLVPLRLQALEGAELGHGFVYGLRVDQVEVVHADQVQQEVAAQAALHDDGGVVRGEQQAGLLHLVVGDKTGRKTDGQQPVSNYEKVRLKPAD